MNDILKMSQEFKQAKIVLELFTSQGCSSCPPADVLLENVAQMNKNILPLSFHVDYWDYLGWKDPFSSKEHTIRQSKYREKFNEKSMYTPQMVVNGSFGFVGSQKANLIQAVSSSSNLLQSIIHVDCKGEILLENIYDCEIQIVKYYKYRQTKALRGENGGRLLSNCNIVYSLLPWKAGTRVDFPKEGEGVAVLAVSRTTKKIVAASFC
jgi:hypothetical protein